MLLTRLPRIMVHEWRVPRSTSRRTCSTLSSIAMNPPMTYRKPLSIGRASVPHRPRSEGHMPLVHVDCSIQMLKVRTTARQRSGGDNAMVKLTARRRHARPTVR